MGGVGEKGYRVRLQTIACLDGHVGKIYGYANSEGQAVINWAVGMRVCVVVIMGVCHCY